MGMHLEGLVDDFGSDPNAKDRARVLRLPGFWHRKDPAHPHRVRIVSEAGRQPFAWPHLSAVLPPAAPASPGKEEQPKPNTIVITDETKRELRSALNYILPNGYSAWIRIGQALCELGNVGRGLWLDWSQQSDKWQPQDARRWNTFTGERTGYQAVFAEAQRQGWVNPLSRSTPTSDTEPGKSSSGWRLVPVSELLDAPAPLRWLIRDFLQPDSLNLLFGDSAAGKSFLALSWAAAVATGRAWGGHVTDAAPVVYLAGEGHWGIRRRLLAWGIAHDCLDTLKAAPLVVSSTGAALTDPAHLTLVVDAIDIAAAQHGKPALVVVDTLARNLGAADESSAADIGAFVKALDHLRVRYGSAVLVVHHSGHQDKGRSRGSSAIRGALDAEFCLATDPDGTRTLTSTKSKDTAPPAPRNFGLKEVKLPWTTVDGVYETSAVLVDIGPDDDGDRRRRKAPPTVTLAFQALLATLDDTGTAPSDSWQPSSGTGPRPERVVNLDDWRREFHARHTGDTEETKSRVFRRARDQLVRSTAVAVWKDVYWPRTDVAPWPDLAAMLSAAEICRSANEI